MEGLFRIRKYNCRLLLIPAATTTYPPARLELKDSKSLVKIIGSPLYLPRNLPVKMVKTVKIQWLHQIDFTGYGVPDSIISDAPPSQNQQIACTGGIGGKGQ